VYFTNTRKYNLTPFRSVDRDYKRHRDGKKENQTQKIRDNKKESTTLP
jgi:hypothetical protein